MRIQEFTLPAGGVNTVGGAVIKIVAVQASGEFEVKTNRESFTMSAGHKVTLEVETNNLVIRDLSGLDNQIRLVMFETINGDFAQTMGSVEVGNFPANQIVTIDNVPEVQKVTVENLPDDQAVTVGNFPCVQKVTVENLPDDQAVTVGNFPSVQKVIVENLPDDQAVTVGNFPAVQKVAVESGPPPMTNAELLQWFEVSGDYTVHHVAVNLDTAALNDMQYLTGSRTDCVYVAGVIQATSGTITLIDNVVDGAVVAGALDAMPGTAEPIYIKPSDGYRFPVIAKAGGADAAAVGSIVYVTYA